MTQDETNLVVLTLSRIETKIDTIGAKVSEHEGALKILKWVVGLVAVAMPTIGEGVRSWFARWH